MNSKTRFLTVRRGSYKYRMKNRINPLVLDWNQYNNFNSLLSVDENVYKCVWKHTYVTCIYFLDAERA